MNYYFLLEDEKSFMKVLPKWLEYLQFNCTRVADIKQVTDNNYILQSGKGVTQLVTKVLFDTIDTILCNPEKIDKLIVLIDTENENEDYRQQQVFSKIKEKYEIEKFNFEVLVFVCNHCFESWLLGAEGIYPSEEVETTSDFYPFYQHYNIEVCDPEKMEVPDYCDDTIAKYHFHYLCELFRYRKIRYSKSRPQAVETYNYFYSIFQRKEHTEHIRSFASFVDFILNEKK